MTFGQLALSNIRGSSQRYAAFFLSAVFSVVLFFLYAQFIFHPDVNSGYIYGAEGVRVGMIACEVLIIVFSFFFVLYSTTSFLRARHQEFGLLALLGTSRRQLRMLIWLENTFLSLAATGVGLGLGLLFSKLFLMGMSRVLMIESPIRFMIVPQAILVTAVGFFLLFQVITLFAVLGIGRQNVIDLLKAARKPKDPPRASLFLAALSLLLIGGGYYVAATVPASLILVVFFPVIGVVTLGTYLLFGQASVFILRALQRRPALYLRGPRTVIISQLVFRMRDNSRLLASVAILSAIVLSASGTFYIMSRQFEALNDSAHPQALAIVEPGVEGQQAPDPADVDAILAEHGVEPTFRVDINAVEVEYRLASQTADTINFAALLPESAYREVVRQSGGDIPAADLARGELLFIDHMPVIAPEMEAPDPEEIVLHDKEWLPAARLNVTESIGQMLLNVAWTSGPWMVANDEDFAAIAEAAPTENDLRIYAVDWSGWSRSRGINEQVSQLVGDEQWAYTADRYQAWGQVRQTLGLTMFIGLFISLLFFVAAGSMIYFKLFTELRDDQHLFVSLKRIGITGREAASIISTQMGIIFFLPFLVGAIHTLFALDALGTLLSANVVGYALLVVALFALVQGAFFLLTRWTYLRALRPAA